MEQNYISSAEEQKQRLDQFRSWHDEAYLYINQAITQEKPNIGRQDVALMMYQKGLGLIDQAICADTEMGDGPTWEKARKMQLKMSKTRSHVQSRILEITNQLAPPLDENISIMHQTPAKELNPLSAGSEITSTSRESTSTMQNQGQNIKQVLLPSYEDSMSQNPSQPPPPYTLSESTSFQPEPIEVNLSSNEMKRSATADSVGNSVQGEILFRMEGVQVFHVTASGEVSTPSYPETLHLVKFQRERNSTGGKLPPAFIEVGEWTYPLVRGESPVLKSQYGGYMFPDLESDIRGGAVGIIIPENVTETEREMFDSLLAKITSAFKTQVG